MYRNHLLYTEHCSITFRYLMGKILIVDDEFDIVSSIQQGLTRNGFQVDAYTEPQKIAKEFVAGTYDLAIIDIRMPQMNGFELSRELQTKDDKIKICFLTAFDIYYSEFKTMFGSSGVRCFIRKPTTLKSLVSHITSELKTT